MIIMEFYCFILFFFDVRMKPKYANCSNPYTI